jgi:hypothetical protein
MKTERFGSIVQAAGNPVAHLLLISPEKDKVLQTAIKTNRVLTVHQNLTGNKADYGTIGFEPGGACQYFIFPKSLAKFRETRIVGIKYDLLKAGVSKDVGKTVAQPQRSASQTSAGDRGRRERPKKKVEPQEVPTEKLVHFTRPELQEERDAESQALQEIKNQVRQAMKILEEGKQVAAFNLLKSIVEH